MNRKILCVVLGAAALAASTAASAHVDVALGVDAPGGVAYAPAQTAYVAPAPPAAYSSTNMVATGWREDEYWRAHEWREHEWRERERRERRWREHQWREREWRDHRRWDY